MAEAAKRILKAELVKRGITNEALANLLNNYGSKETKQSVDSKIYRGRFSAAFLLKCLNIISCKSFDKEVKIIKAKREK